MTVHVIDMALPLQISWRHAIHDHIRWMELPWHLPRHTPWHRHGCECNIYNKKQANMACHDTAVMSLSWHCHRPPWNAMDSMPWQSHEPPWHALLFPLSFVARHGIAMNLLHGLPCHYHGPSWHCHGVSWQFHGNPSMAYYHGMSGQCRAHAILYCIAVVYHGIAMD